MPFLFFAEQVIKEKNLHLYHADWPVGFCMAIVMIFVIVSACQEYFQSRKTIALNDLDLDYVMFFK
ncbi:hypothetical protein P0136_08105 [Lentisphaerota bacterium ZTH]|nr:hypothetical protein JYG24_00785 [Lentisphaerota bacterium]WET05326.1 hypothetical protein P0136_08105 [Lentisphaerota bacterium ZTH]